MKYPNQKISILLLWVFILLGNPFGVFGQEQTYVHDVLTVKDGLSSNSCRSVLQGPRGFLWIGTEQGLNRYDGHEIKVFQHDPKDSLSLSSNRISHMVFSEDSLLWIGTMDFVLHCFDPATEKFIRYPMPVKNARFSSDITSMMAEENKRIWIGFRGGLVCLERATNELQYIKPSNHLDYPPPFNSRFNSALCFSEDPFDSAWLLVGTYRGFYRIHRATKEVIFPPKHIFKKTESWMIRDILIEAGHLWVSTNYRYIRKINIETGSYISYPYPENHEFTTHHIFPVDESSFLVGTREGGMGVFNKKTGISYFRKERNLPEKGINSHAVHEFFQDKNGTIWVATDDGIHYYKPSRLSVNHFICDLTAQELNDKERELRTEGIVWLPETKTYIVGTIKGDLFWINESGESLVKTTLTTTKNWIAPHINSLHLTEDRVWIGAGNYDGLKYIPRNSKEIHHFRHSLIDSNSVIIIKNDNKGFLVFNTYPPSRIYFLNLQDLSVKYYSFDDRDDSYILDVGWFIDYAIDSKGDLWLTTRIGLVYFNRTSEEAILFSESEDSPVQLASSSPFKVEVDKNDVVWIGHTAMGLESLHRTSEGTFITKSYRYSDQISKDQIYDLEVDSNNNLWITHPLGLTHFDTEKQVFQLFKPEDGLLTHGFVSKVIQNNKLILGGPGLFSVLNGSTLTADSITPNVIFSGISLFEKPLKPLAELDPSKGLKLNHDENYFTLQFATPAFIGEGKHYYRYQLEGYDDNWHYCQNGKAPYTNVTPGNYTFKVQASKEDNNWNDQITMLPIQIIPAFWQTLWFKALLFLLFISGGISFGLWRIRQVKEKERLKAEFERQLLEVEMSALRAQMNPHFIFNSLNSIKNFIIQNEPRMASRYLTKFSQLMRLILNNSKNPTVRLEDELKALDLYCQLENMRFENKFEYTIEVSENVDSEFIEIPPLILQPYVENAIWHGLMNKETKGKLEIRVQQQNGDLQIVVQDDGIGREKAMEIKNLSALKRKSMGMQITSERLDLINERNKGKAFVKIIDLKNESGEAIGTKVKISIPV